MSKELTNETETEDEWVEIENKEPSILGISDDWVEPSYW
jgi:hypothetical protein